MGCGSSSLKGEAPKGLSNDVVEVDERPMRRVATDFTTVDYEQERQSQGERRNTEYAPDETERTASVTSDAIRHARSGILPKENKDSGAKAGDQPLKPYQSIDAGVAAVSATATDPLDPTARDMGEQLKPYQSIDAGNALDAADPRSTAAKNNFASANDPASPANQLDEHDQQQQEHQQQEPPLITGIEETSSSSDPIKWQNKNINEQDLIKYTGKTKGEIQDLVDHGDGVGGGQPADNRYAPITNVPGTTVA